MTRRQSSLRSWIVALAIVAMALPTACSSSDNTDSTGDDGETATTAPAFDPGAVRTASVQGPVIGGKGRAVLGPPGFDLATVGYQEDEYFLSGTATSYTSDAPLTSDGQWTVREDATAPYTTRIVVRRPTDPASFNGTVYVEWLNVSGGLDASPDWTFAHVAMIRAGAAWVGVSAQVVGIEGGGGPGAVLALKTADAERYAPLSHPGDDYSYDLFSQAGAAVRTQSTKVLGGLAPQRVLGIGESQSAFRLSTYVNAVAPTTNVFDGYLLHSRGAVGAPLQLGTRTGSIAGSGPAPAVPAPDPTLVRADLGVPVLVLSSESDVVGNRLGYARARQPDTDTFRGWEVAGTSHGDAYSLGIGDGDDGSGAGDEALFAAMTNPPASIYGGVITCDAPINAGPHTYVARAAVIALDSWVRTGEPPASMPQLTVDASGTDYVRDQYGIAEGGIRTPQVDAPIATLSGLGQTGQSFCGLFGTTVPFDPSRVVSLYPDHATFVEQWNTALDAAVGNGAVLLADADRLRTVAQSSTIGG